MNGKKFAKALALVTVLFSMSQSQAGLILNKGEIGYLEIDYGSTDLSIASVKDFTITIANPDSSGPALSTWIWNNVYLG